MIRTVASLACVLAFGCAAQSDEKAGAGGGAGGKADDASTQTGTLTEMDEEGQSYLRAADAECLHVNYTRNETYDQGVKLICMPRGGVAAPLLSYIAVTPLGEADGAYKVYEVPVFMSDNPESVEFRMVGDKAIYSFDVKQPDFDTDELAYLTKHVTVELRFSGSSEDPAVAATYSVTGP